MRNRLLFAGVVGLLLCGSALGQTEPTRSETESVQNYKVAKASYNKAKKHFDKRDLEKTVKELGACLKRVPEFSEAHFLLAKVDYLEKRYPEALASMELAVATFEASNALYLELQGDRFTELQRQRDELDLRVAYLRDALSQPITDEQRAVLQNQMAQVEQDKQALERLLYKPPADVTAMPADYPFFHGNILLRLNRLDDAAAKYREALKIKPDHVEASNNLASLYLSAGHPKVAKEILEQAEANGVTVNADLKQAVLNAIK